MKRMNGLGDLERAVMDTLWASPTPQTVRQVHESLSRDRSLAYTTV
ncbi:BlaI/MecI/CopY family transcriptional regulator, partial [Streptomyces sp. SID10244]|nr:BlaI/MecI/CopY family transcriptional regulator [Streptomyces sp. SID10244]